MRGSIPLLIVLTACAGSREDFTQLTRCAVDADEQTSLELLEARLPAAEPASFAVEIDVHAHVIQSAAGEDELDDATLASQIEVMNDAYAGGRGGAATGFRFRLASVDRTVNARWAAMSRFSAAEREAKTALRRGGAADLNIYFAPLGDDHLGWSTFPQKYNDKPTLDGVVVKSASLPGGDAFPYDEGMTAVHEAGHWLGLYHTFHHGCDSPGDSVSDTPRVGAANHGCPTGIDSCPSAPGEPVRLDAVHNVMDYTDDACMTELSRGQRARMERLWALRAGG